MRKQKLNLTTNEIVSEVSCHDEVIRRLGKGLKPTTYLWLPGAAGQRCWRWSYGRSRWRGSWPRSGCFPDSGSAETCPRHCWCRWGHHGPIQRRYPGSYNGAWEQSGGERKRRIQLAGRITQNLKELKRREPGRLELLQLHPHDDNLQWWHIIKQRSVIVNDTIHSGRHPENDFLKDVRQMSLAVETF